MIGSSSPVSFARNCSAMALATSLSTAKMSVSLRSISPNMGIVSCFDQLHIDPNLVARFLHAAFQDISHAQLPRDLGQFIGGTFVTLRRGARDYFQVRDLRKARQYLVLDAVGEVSVAIVFAQTFEWKHRDRFIVDFPARDVCFSCSAACCECKNRKIISRPRRPRRRQSERFACARPCE